MTQELLTPSSFYRVTSRALVYDATKKLLVMKNADGNYEIPGGGWEHDESYEQCIQRELHEELGVRAQTIGSICGTWVNTQTWYGVKVLRIAAKVSLLTHDFKIGSEIQAIEWVDKSRFMDIDWRHDGDDAKCMAAVIWEDYEE